MRVNFLFRHRIATIAVIADILVFSLTHIILLYVVPIDEIFINSNDYPLYFSLINVWRWFHVPIALLPISSSIICYGSCHVVEIIRNTVHIILCFSQTYIVFYVLGFLLEIKRKKRQWQKMWTYTYDVRGRATQMQDVKNVHSL